MNFLPFYAPRNGQKTPFFNLFCNCTRVKWGHRKKSQHESCV